MTYLKLLGISFAIFTSFISASHAGNVEPTRNPEEIMLSQEEVKFVRWLIATDDMIKTASQEGQLLYWLNKAISIVAPGPIKLIQQWNMGALEGWRKANKKLVTLKRQVHCERIHLRISEETENSPFFEKLYKARGCEEN